MVRPKQKKKRDKKRSIKSAVASGPIAQAGPPLTESWRGRVMQSEVRRGERQPGRSS